MSVEAKRIFPAAKPMRNEEQVLLVANPTSRGGKAAVRLDRVRALMDLQGFPYAFEHTLPNGKTMELVNRAIIEGGFRTIVYLGGDGTFNEVAKGICMSGKAGRIKLGMLPSGTANDQGKSFGISSSTRALEKNLEIIASGYTTQLDVGEVTAYSYDGSVQRRDLFFDSVGWGLSAAILAFRNHELEIVKKVPVVRDMYRDHMVYIRASMRELALSWVTRDRFTAEVTVDGETHTVDGLSDLVVNNTSVYAGDWIIDHECRHDDGKFEVTLFRGVRDWTSKLILHHKKFPLTEEMVNRIGVSHSPSFRGSEIKIQFFRPNKDKRLLAQLDGDEFPPSDRFDICVHPRLINLIVPRNFHWI